MKLLDPLNHPIYLTRPLKLDANSNWAEHVPFGMYLTELARPHVLVEIGTTDGVSYCAFCQAIKKLRILNKSYAIGNWAEENSSSESLSALRNYHDPLYGEFSSLIQGSFLKTAGSFSDASVDLLHLTGFQNHEDTGLVLNTWLPKLSDRGIILLHGINMRVEGYTVWQLWKQLQSQYPHFEFTHAQGLGILKVGKQLPPLSEAFFSIKDEEAIISVRESFFWLGSRLAADVKKEVVIKETQQSLQELTQVVEKKGQEIQNLTARAFEAEKKFEFQRLKMEKDEKLIGFLKADFEKKADEAKMFSSRLYTIENSTSWKLMNSLIKIRSSLIPSKSLQERLIRGLLNLPRSISRRIRRKPRLRLATDAYLKWIAENEPVGDQLAAQTEQASRLSFQPLISLVTPVYNPPVSVLKDTLESVLCQTYQKWELCIANGDVSNKAITALLAKYAQRDARIKVTNLDANQGIAGNSNAAIGMALGEYVAFLDHDDMIAPFALFEVVLAINENPVTDLFFSDEDKLSEAGERFAEFFKPGFSPDRLRSVNYMTHFLVVRKSLGDQIGWVRKGFEGAQDYDFILRAMEQTRNIVRIPKILYHWRMVEGSAASGADAKPYAGNSGVKALQEHLQRMKIAATVEINQVSTWYNVRYELTAKPLVSIIIPNHNHADDLRRCINSILMKSTYYNFEIVIVENNSSDADTFLLYEFLQKLDKRVSVIEWSGSFNYSLVNNWAARQANGEVFLFLNNDVEVINPDWLEQMLMHALRPEVGTVGAKLYYPNDTIQHAGIIVGIGGIAGHSHKGSRRDSLGHFGQLIQVRNVAANTAACVMVRKQIFEEVDGFDEKYILAFGDVDFGLKVSDKGYLNIWSPFAELYHHESKTRGYEVTSEQIARAKREGAYFKHKWAAWLEKGDPYYNPNFSLDYEDFRLKLK